MTNNKNLEEKKLQMHVLISLKCIAYANDFQKILQTYFQELPFLLNNKYSKCVAKLKSEY